MKQFPKSISFREITDWDNLTLADYDTISKLFRYVYKQTPSVCCAHKKEPFLKNLNEATKSRLKEKYDSIVSIHCKYNIKCSGMIRIREISNNTICVDTLDEETIARIIAVTGNQYIEQKKTRKKSK